MTVKELLKRAIKIIQSEGLKTLCKKVPPYIYEQLWPFLPKDSAWITYNGVKITSQRITDKYVGSYIKQYTDYSRPDYEPVYIPAIRDYVSTGDSVIMIGGGNGVSAVVAAKQVGSGGNINLFEGAASEVEKCRQTRAINDITCELNIHHAVVGSNVSLRGEMRGAKCISPNELEKCDALLIDCDGAEFSILNNLKTRPKKIIVEHHPVPGSDGMDVKYKPNRIRNILDDLGYEIIDECFSEDNAYNQYPEIVFVAQAK
jgi:hypothetical protein